MDRLDAMGIFVAAVDGGSLAAAARRYGRSAAAATRAVVLLEGLAGETLLRRSTRRLSLTTAGEHHVSVWRDVLARLGELAPAAIGGAVAGPIVITAPELFGRLKVMPVVESFLHAYPQVSARVLMLNRVVDLVGEGVDLAVRLASLPDSSLTAVKLGEVRRIVCASPAYLARYGAPKQPQALEGHSCVGINVEGDRELWTFGSGQSARPRIRAISVRTRLSLNSAGAAIDVALRGLGIVRQLSYQVAEDLAAGRLVRLLAAYEPPPTPMHLVFRPELAKRGVLRAFVAHAVPPLRIELTRLSGVLKG